MSAAEQARPALPPVADDGDRPDPVIHPDSQEFWSSLARGELRLQRCTACGTWRYPVSPVCHRCLAFDFTWEPVSPAGRVAAAVVVQRATGEAAWSAHVPFASGIVDVEHGVRLPGRILCACGEGLRHGAAVRAVVLTSAGHVPVMAFRHDCERDPA
jgi:uncharacterized OB-fold protein